MKTIQSIVNYYNKGCSIKKMARLLGISKNTVKKYIRALKASNFDLSTPLTEEQVATIQTRCKHKDNDTQQELVDYLSQNLIDLKSTGVTRYTIWEEYRQVYPEGYSYVHFCRIIKEYKNREKATMLLDHKPGQVMQVDFAGKKLQWTDRYTNEVHFAEVLVITFPFSGQTFIVAVDSQRQEDFIDGLNQALLFFGGCPPVIMSDNLKSFVTKADRYEPTFTQLCHQFSTYYGIELDATRVAKPKDKASVERHVQVAYNKVYAKIRHQTYHSLEELNAAMRPRIDTMNSELKQGKTYSRQQLFDQYEKDKLAPLPSSIFQVTKRTKAKVATTYHVYLGEDKHHYSVPYKYIGKTTQIEYTKDTVEIYIGTARIATHPRNTEAGRYTTTVTHRPISHQKHLEILQMDHEQLVEKASHIGDHVCHTIRQLLNRKSFIDQNRKSCLGVLRLAELYGHERLNKACHMTRDFGKINYLTIKNILVNKTDQLDTQNKEINEDQSYIPTHGNLRGAHNYKMKTDDIDNSNNIPINI